jgi:hypothetical protein
MSRFRPRRAPVAARRIEKKSGGLLGRKQRAIGKVCLFVQFGKVIRPTINAEK